MPDSLRDQIQTSLGSAYALERELGGGGMSRVFLAREAALDRDIVVKVLSPELAAGVSAERFAREIKLAASLQQANIVPLLATGETGGLPYYTMPFVAGLSLRARLERTGALPVAEVISVLRDVARALAYAHERGVVHRDIKPENILLSGDAAVVTDFGIAKALSASRTKAPGDTLTQVGTSIGTPAYMAPEQAAGDPATDHRADLYALGCVAYEMLTGAAPFAGRPMHQLYAAHLTETPAPLEKARVDVPRSLAALVMRCLEKDPARRPQRARDVLDALDGIGPAHTSGESSSPAKRGRQRTVAMVAGLGVVVAAAALGGWALRARGTTAHGADVDRIAVLPFQNLGDSADAYFADGITDAVRGKLTALPGMTVIARASSVTYRGTTKSPETIAGELHVRYLLTGTVRFAGSGAERRVQVSPELVQVAGGGPAESRWQQPFDAPVKDVFGVQADIASRVATALDVALGDSAKHALVARPTMSLPAYDAFLKGEAANQGGTANDPPSLRRAIGFLEQAVELDPSFSLAWARLAVARSLLYSNGLPTSTLAEQAREAAERASALAPGSTDAAAAMSYYARIVARDPARALAALQQGVRAAPTDVTMLSSLSSIEHSAGRMESALGYARRAAALDPRSARAAIRLASVLLASRRDSDAQAVADSAIAIAPGNLNIVQQRAIASLAQGDLAAARAVIHRVPATVDHGAVLAYLGMYNDLFWVLDDADQRRLLSLSPRYFDGDRGAWASVLAQSHYLRGDMARTRAYADSALLAMEETLRTTPDDPQLHLFRGLMLAYLGRTAEATREGERGAAMTPLSRDAVVAPYLQYVLARLYTVVGARDKALSTLDGLLSMPYFVTGAWLRIDPSFAPLRGDPRFEALVAKR